MTYVAAQCPPQSSLLQKDIFPRASSQDQTVPIGWWRGEEEGCVCICLLPLCRNSRFVLTSISDFLLLHQLQSKQFMSNLVVETCIPKHQANLPKQRGFPKGFFSDVSRFSSVQRFSLSFSKSSLLMYILLKKNDHIPLSDLFPTVLLFPGGVDYSPNSVE